MIAIFINPSPDLKILVKKWKNILKSRFKNSDYLNHPVHATIFVADIKNQIKYVQHLREKLSKFKRFEISISKKGIFYNDILTNKDTLYLKINKKKNLYDLQDKIAKLSQNFIIPNSSKLDKIKDSKQRNSYKKYGFLFVGQHWIPHFTIGSVKNIKQYKVFNKFIKKKINYQLEIKDLSVWLIKNNSHKKLYKIKLSQNEKS